MITSLLDEAKKDDVIVTISPDGKLKISGEREMVEKWKPILAERKSELLEKFEQLNTPSWRWRVTFPDGRVILSHNVPFATREEVARIYPDAKHLEAA